MKTKLKLCSGCQTMKVIWKSKTKEHGMLCKDCSNKLSNKTLIKNLPESKVIREPISKLSDKEKKRQALYSVLKKEFMKTHGSCEVKLIGCLGKATDVHHLYFGADRYGHFLDSTTWKSTCRNCHSTIHDKLSNEQLLKLGLRLK